MSEEPNLDLLVHELFEQMEWSEDLIAPLLNDLFQNYQPTPFADALPFLEQFESGRSRSILSLIIHVRWTMRAYLGLNHSLCG